MTLDLPFWIKQRQAKVEELATGSYKITGPNLPEAVVSVRMDDNLKWRAILSPKQDSPILAETAAEFPTPKEALAAAFEMYRIHFVV